VTELEHAAAAASSAPALPLLRAVSVSRTFGRGEGAVHALKGANLSVYPGQLIALKGRSGSGKTTLLNILAALDMPTEGQVYYGERSLGSMSERERDRLRRKDIGLIFQSFALVPYMSAYENVEFGLRISGADRDKRRQLAEQALEFVGLKQRMNHRPQELSGGEQQRTAIARAIAHKPKLVLADEPTAELDSRMGLQVIKVFRDLVEREGISVVMTTHDPAIMEIVDIVYALEDGQIVEQIS
jgi:putative ABC transport system ATP-binding protein